MNRRVEPEQLDELPPKDPRAVGSRRDLRRVNAWMGNVGTIARALRLAFPEASPHRLADLGAGDGDFMLRLAGRLPRGWGSVEVLLLDKQNSVQPETLKGFERLGWQPQVLELDVLDWLRAPAPTACDALIANLFLHHLPEPQLAEVLDRAAARTRVFVAVEPRRSAWALALSRLLWLIGCNAVTRHDAPISVRAGFAGCELSRLWPMAGTPGQAGRGTTQPNARAAPPSLPQEERARERRPLLASSPMSSNLRARAARVWSLREGPAGMASHAFVASKTSL